MPGPASLRSLLDAESRHDGRGAIHSVCRHQSLRRFAHYDRRSVTVAIRVGVGATVIGQTCVQDFRDRERDTPDIDTHDAAANGHQSITVRNRRAGSSVAPGSRDSSAGHDTPIGVAHFDGYDREPFLRVLEVTATIQVNHAHARIGCGLNRDADRCFIRAADAIADRISKGVCADIIGVGV